MGHDLVVDGRALGAAASRVSALADALGASAEEVRDVQDAVGSAPQVQGLLAALSGFESSWSVRRDAVQGTMLSLADALVQVESGFEDAESALVQAAAPAPTATGASGRQVV